MSTFEVDSIKARHDFAANSVVIDVVSGGVSIRMLVAPSTANQAIRQIQDAMGQLGHTTWMTPPESDDVAQLKVQIDALRKLVGYSVPAGVNVYLPPWTQDALNECYRIGALEG